MSIFNRLFHKKNKEVKEPIYDWEEERLDWSWDSIIEEQEQPNLKDSGDRISYVSSCIDEMNEAGGELERLSYEYDAITSDLEDIELIEKLDELDKKPIVDCARTLLTSQQDSEAYINRVKKISDNDYNNMDANSELMPMLYDRIKGTEDYMASIKRDLTRLESEKQGNYYRKNDLTSRIDNARSMLIIVAIAIVLCIGVLLVLQLFYEMDAMIGYVLVTLGGAIFSTALYVGTLNDRDEIKRLEIANNKVILLQNTVKIRYVNNRNLLDYQYLKYGIKSSKQLKKLWSDYIEEKREKERYLESQTNMSIAQRELTKLIYRQGVRNINVWAYRASAIVDSREMVEVRHNLVIRRQKIRSAIKYNNKLIEDKNTEIKDIIDKYPKYAADILRLIEVKRSGEVKEEGIN